MKQITSYDQVSPLILKYFKRGVITNNFLSIDDYKCEIEERNLFYDCNDEFLNIYVKRPNFYYLYFYAFNENVIFPNYKEKIVCDVSDKSIKIMENNQFVEVMQRVKVEMIGTKSKKSSCKAKITDADEIFKLMNNSFDQYTGYIPNYTQIKQECEKGLIYTIKENHKVVGILRTEKKGNITQLKHLCADKEFRNKGIGKKLCLECINENEKMYLWANKEYEYLLEFYKKLGFTQSDKNTIVYMKG